MTPSGRKGRKRKRQTPRPGYRKQARAPHAPQGPETGALPAPALHPRQPGSVVSLEPLAPVIVRSGRPLDGRSDADPARFPPPSTVAGCLRTAWARETGQPFEPELAKLSVAGPLLLTGDDEVLVPKPADALYFGHGDKARCVRAEPRPFDAGCGADMPDGLLPVQLLEPIDGKPGDGPAWWSWDDLMKFRKGEEITHKQLCKNGWRPPSDRRTHVAIDPGTGAAEAARLFQTQGLDLDMSPAAFRASAIELCRARSPEPGTPHSPDDSHRSSIGGLRLLARCDEALGETLAHLGGKRRLAALQPEPEQVWPTPPEGWLGRIAEAGGLCLTLLTPGIFSAGYRPGWLDPDPAGNPAGCPPAAPGLRLQLCAAAVGRWQPHSGWDLAQRRPKPGRKLAGAGATYWFRILGGADAGALDAMLKALWLASISDEEQDRRDGFGLVLPSPWTPRS